MLDEIRHKVFISYHGDDRDIVEEFIQRYDKARQVFISRVVGTMASDIEINSEDPKYVMGRIRQLYLSDSTVTIVIVGSCTWARKYVDWEIASSLRQGPVVGSPNGLIGILVPGRTTGKLPDRFLDNWEQDGSGYARFFTYPTSKTQLRSWIEDAFTARRDRNNLISNGRLLRQRNSSCP